MLLPSALPCDMRRPSRSLTPSHLFSTPPPSDDDFPSGNGLLGTCRALQSLLNGPPAPSARRAKPARLQSPLDFTTTPSSTTTPLRPRKQRTTQPHAQPSSSNPSPKPRGANKRTRDSYEADSASDSDSGAEARHTPRPRFSTPKRRRYVPYDLPLGLSQSDFYSLHSPPVTQSPPSPAHTRQGDLCDENASPPVALPSPSQSHSSRFDPDAALPSIEEYDSERWSADDDQRLVETVRRFRLSRPEWDGCARRMDKDQALLGEGDVRCGISSPARRDDT